jgi:hypothetical protein
MKEEKILKHDPLSEADAILSQDFYGSPLPANDDGPHLRTKRKGTDGGPGTKPTHYKVICISMYTQDIEQLEAKVAELKKRGYTKANKSQLIRLALSALDLDTLPPPRGI